MNVLTKSSPENLIVGKRYRYQLSNGNVWHGIFRGLDVEDKRLILEFRQFGVTVRVKWVDVSGWEGQQ